MVIVDPHICIYFLPIISPGKMHIPRFRHFPTQDNQGYNPQTMYSNVPLDILKFSFHHSSTKFPFNRVSNQNWFLELLQSRFLGLLIKNKKIYREDYKSHSFSFKCEHFMHGFRICRQFDYIAIDDRFTLVI